MRERWKPVVGFEGRYEVSNHGRVRSVARRVVHSDGRQFNYPLRILAQTTEHKGYKNVKLTLTHKGKVLKVRTALVHHLVMEAFVGPKPEGMCTRHLDDDPGNDRRSNLRYGTYQKNAQDTVNHGNYPENKTRMKPRDVIRLYKATHKPGAKKRELAEQFGVSLNTVWRVFNKEVNQNILAGL